ncbi:MAG: GNAT family N-acetyltransferase [Acidobacteriota bacterium]
MNTAPLPLSAAAAPQTAPAASVPGPSMPRPAVVDDASSIHALIVRNLEAGHLLPRTLADITRHIQRFVVVHAGSGEMLACAELAPLSAGVAEIRSLVVHEAARGLGLGKLVVGALRLRARAGRFRTLCAFTHDPRLFARIGFSIVPHFWLPEKVGADCWSCPLFQTCGQYAMVDSCLGRAGLPAPGQERCS